MFSGFCAYGVSVSSYYIYSISQIWSKHFVKSGKVRRSQLRLKDQLLAAPAWLRPNLQLRSV